MSAIFALQEQAGVSPHQGVELWWLVDNGDAVLLVSNLDGRCILAGDTWARGDTVVLWDCLGQPQSKWLPMTF